MDLVGNEKKKRPQSPLVSTTEQKDDLEQLSKTGLFNDEASSKGNKCHCLSVFPQNQYSLPIQANTVAQNLGVV